MALHFKQQSFVLDLKLAENKSVWEMLHSTYRDIQLIVSEQIQIYKAKRAFKAAVHRGQI